MRETETFEYIRRKYPDKEETWRKVTRLVKFDENLEVKSVHDFNMECYISSFGRLIRNGILCNMAYGDKYDISSMFTDTDGNQVRFKRHQIVMQTFYMGNRRRYDTVDHINNRERFDNSIYNLRWADKAEIISICHRQNVLLYGIRCSRGMPFHKRRLRGLLTISRQNCSDTRTLAEQIQRNASTQPRSQ